MICFKLGSNCKCPSIGYYVDYILKRRRRKIKKRVYLKNVEGIFVSNINLNLIVDSLEYCVFDNNDNIVIKKTLIPKMKNEIIITDFHNVVHVCNSMKLHIDVIQNFDQSNHLYLSNTIHINNQDTFYLYIQYKTKIGIFNIIHYIEEGGHNNIIFIKNWNDNNVQLNVCYLVGKDKLYSMEQQHANRLIFKETPNCSINNIIPTWFKQTTLPPVSIDLNKNIETSFRYFHQDILKMIATAKKEIVISMYNIEDTGIVNRILDMHKNGIRIIVVTSYKFLTKRHDGQLDSYKILIQNNIPVFVKIHPTREDKHIQSSMHTKICVIDETITLTGSVNWEYNSCNNNDEVMSIYHNHSIALYYKEMVRNFILPSYNVIELPPWFNAFDTQRDQQKFIERMYTVLKDLKKGDVIYMAMFILMDFQLEWEMKDKFSVMDELRLCTERGIKLNIIVEKNTNDCHFGQYYKDKITPNRFVDHIQENWKNTNIWRIKTHRGNNMYSAIHHKFCVINDLTIYGSANWWSVSFDSDDDILMVNDIATARQFTKEWYRLISPTFVVNDVPKILESYEQILGIGVEVFVNDYDVTAIPMLYSDELDEYYGEMLFDEDTFDDMLLMLKQPIRYRYNIVTQNTKNSEIQTDFDLIRSKTFSYYKSTDHWAQRSINDMLNEDVIII